MLYTEKSLDRQKGCPTVRVSPLTSTWKATFISLIIIAIFGLLSYSNTFNASFHFDDKTSITENPAIMDITNLKAIWAFSHTRFITYLSLAINYHFGRLDVFGYHLVNLTIHILTAMLVFWFMRLILLSSEVITPRGNPYLKKKQEKSDIWYFVSDISNIVPLFAALLFVSHPIQTQAVTYIIQRTASLATFFYLLAMVLYMKTGCGLRVASCGLNPQPATRNPQPAIFYIGSILSTILAMFTKETAFTLPVAIVLIEFFFFSPSWSKMKEKITSLIPFLLTIFIIPVTMMITRRVEIGEIGRLASETQVITRWEYLLTQFNVIRTYIRLLFLPFNQNLDYDFPISRTFLEGSTMLSFLLLVFIVFMAIRLFKKERVVSFGIIFFFLALSVESSVIPISDIIFEHRLYLPFIGFAAAVSMGLFSCIASYNILPWGGRESGYPVYLFPGLVFPIIIIFSIAAYERNTVWQDEFLLWKDVVNKSPEKARPHNNLGNAYGSPGRWEEAIKEYRTALQIKSNYPMAHYNLGVTYAIMGRQQEAIKEYQTALQLKPDYPEARYNLSLAYGSVGRQQEAIKEYQTALQLKPDNPDVHYNLGKVYTDVGRYQEAIKEYQMALQLKPDRPEAHNNLGIVYVSVGRYQDAIKEYKRALQLKPDHPEAHYNLGIAYANLGRRQEAVREYRTALRIKPDYPKAHNNLGLAYANVSRYQDAIKEYRMALRLKSNYFEAHNNLGNAYYSIDRWQEAIQEYQRALRLRPDAPVAHNNLGFAYSSLNRYQDAIKEYRMALQLKPDYTKARYNLGSVYARLERWQEASQEWTTTLSIDPDHKGAKRGLDAARHRMERPR